MQKDVELNQNDKRPPQAFTQQPGD